MNYIKQQNLIHSRRGEGKATEKANSTNFTETTNDGTIAHDNRKYISYFTLRSYFILTRFTTNKLRNLRVFLL